MSTSRLKKKVEQQQSSNADSKDYGNLLESFVSFGTALPSLASTSKDAGEFVPIWEQQVTDEQGRRRFHGAFTGGFSAGFYNTVGSKEGWSPSTFTSSRSIRATKDSTLTTQDLAKGLMDEEDLAELNSSRTLQTSSTYAAPSSATYDPLLGPISLPTASLAPTAALASLIEPASARIGLKLMRKMGWREGQGVGPRLTLLQRRAQAKELGITLDDDGEGGDDEEARKHYYAPLDRPLALMEEVGVATDRGWGLGYHPVPVVALARVAASRASAAMDLDGEEEEDVYGPIGASVGETSSKRPKWVQDLEDQDDGFDYQIKGTTKGKEREQRARSKPSKTSSSKVDTFHDGTQVLSGFTIYHERFSGASTSQLPPVPPRNWIPNPSRIWTDTTASTVVTIDSKGKGRQLDAETRGDLLGEQKPPPLPKSVFEYLSARSRERLGSLSATSYSVPAVSQSFIDPSASSSNLTPLGTNSRVPIANLVPPEPEDALLIPPLDAPTALAALQGFQPFAPSSTSADPIRQARYTLFLQYHAKLLPPSSTAYTLPFGPRRSTVPSSAVGHRSGGAGVGEAGGRDQSIREFNKELDDYAKAARVFKPVSGLLAGRFTSTSSLSTSTSTYLEEGPKIAPGLWQPPKKPAVDPASGGVAKLEEYRSEAQHAAREGRFGPLTTRSVVEFRPARLVCKRFGVKNPFDDLPDGSGAGRRAGDDEEEDSGRVGGAWKEAGRYRAMMNGNGKGGGKVDEPLGKASMEALMKAASSSSRSALDFDFESITVPSSTSTSTSTSAVTKSTASTTASSNVKTLETVGLGDDEQQGIETLTYTKAPLDIFKAIFAESDDDDDDDDDDDEDDDERNDDDRGVKLDARQGGVKMIESGQSMAAVVPVSVSTPSVVVAKAEDDSHDTALPSALTLASTDDISLSTETLASYRPSFVPSLSRSTFLDSKSTTTSSFPSSSNLQSTSTKDEKDSGKEGKEGKKEKKPKKEKRKSMLSFDVEDDDPSSSSSFVALTKKRKTSTLAGLVPPPVRARVEEEDDGWTEVRSTVHPSILAAVASSSAVPTTKPPFASTTSERLVGAAGKEGDGRQKRQRAADLY